MSDRSRKDFPEALRDLMDDRGYSVQRLAIASGRHRPGGKGYSTGTIAQWTARHRNPTIENIEIVAKTLNADPRYFREYREYLAAEEAKRMANEVGLDKVLDALRRLAA